MAWRFAATAASNLRPSSLCLQTLTLPIFGPYALIPRARSTQRVVRLQKYFASIRTASRAWSSNRSEILLRSEEHTSELQSHLNIVCRLLLEKKKQLILHPSHQL